MSPMRSCIELIDVADEADSIADTFSEALQANDINVMRHCFTRLVLNHKAIVHILTELCEDVEQMK